MCAYQIFKQYLQNIWKIEKEIQLLQRLFLCQSRFPHSAIEPNCLDNYYYSIHQPQLAYLSQQQVLAAASTPRPVLSANFSQPVMTGLTTPRPNVLSQNWSNVHYQTPGTVPHISQKGFNNFNQVVLRFRIANSTSNW